MGYYKLIESGVLNNQQMRSKLWQLYLQEEREEMFCLLNSTMDALYTLNFVLLMKNNFMYLFNNIWLNENLIKNITHKPMTSIIVL